MLRPLGKGVRIALVGLLATACAPRTQYMGLDLRPGSAIASDMRSLAERARSGDKQAQYELGRWFEASTDADGLKKAIKLYQIAATPRGGSQLMFVPGPSGVTTSVVNTGPKIEPNKAAQDRLRLIAIDKKSRIRSGRLTSANLYELPVHAKLPISEKLIIGHRRLVYGTLKNLEFSIPEETQVCAFFKPLYEKYFDSKVDQCGAYAYILNGSKVIYNLTITIQIQNDRLAESDDPYWIWLEGTTKAPIESQHCGQFYINSVGTRHHYYEILIAPAKAGKIDFELSENGGMCNVRNSN